MRCRGKLVHDFFFASPAGDYTVYIERLRPQEGFRLKSRETGVIGLEYPLGENRAHAVRAVRPGLDQGLRRRGQGP